MFCFSNILSLQKFLRKKKKVRPDHLRCHLPSFPSITGASWPKPSSEHQSTAPSAPPSVLCPSVLCPSHVALCCPVSFEPCHLMEPHCFTGFMTMTFSVCGEGLILEEADVASRCSQDCLGHGHLPGHNVPTWLLLDSLPGCYYLVPARLPNCEAAVCPSDAHT